MSGSLILVAGYPKSGSTWVRLMFEALTRSLDGCVAINELGNGFYGGWRRQLFDDLAPVDAADLLAEEIDELLPHVFRQLAADQGIPILVKAHDVAFRTRSGEWLYPPDCVRSVIYLVRHPFDVAISFAHHLGLSVETAVDIMNRDHVMAPTGPRMVLPLHERIGSWSSNIGSWLDDAPYPLVLARYEDLHSDPGGSFARIAAAAGLSKPADAIRRAAEAVSFNRLKTEEGVHGFSERPRSSPMFFRAGRPGTWRGSISASLQENLVSEHGAMMKRLGYGADGEVTLRRQIDRPPSETGDIA